MANDADLEGQVLIPNEEQLFSSTRKLEVWQRSNNISEKIFPGCTNELRSILMRESPVEEFVYLISQKHSWSGLEISAEMFKIIFAFHNVHTKFLDYVSTFGRKVSGEDDALASSYDRMLPRRKSSDEHSRSDRSELCYVLRHFERHGRANLSNPWSLRKMAVYHKYHFQARKSLWIVIAAFQNSKRSLWDHMSRKRQESDIDSHFSFPGSVHASLVEHTTENWGAYLNFQRIRLEGIAQRIQFCMLDLEDKDCDIGLRDAQSLNGFRYELLTASHILDSNLRITRGLRKQYKNCLSLQFQLSHADIADIEARFEVLIDKMETYKGTAATLLSHLEGVSSLLLKTLDIREHFIVAKYRNTFADIALQVNDRIDVVKRISEDTGKDSQSLRIIGFITMLFLPGSLIASLFSTNVIQISDITNRLEINANLWVYVISTLSVTGVTVLVAFWWDRMIEKHKSFLRAQGP